MDLNSRLKPQRTLRKFKPVLVLGFVLLAALLAGCESDDCVNCVELPPPVVPTGVHSISGDQEIIVQWYDISYAPYDGAFNENVVSYAIYSRFYQPGDENDGSREFFFIGEVAWDENFDPGTGLHWFYDTDVAHGEQYEYAVAAVNAAGRESALSFELVTDAPLPMSPLDGQGWHIPLTLFDGNGATSEASGFDFERAAGNQSSLNAGRVNPATEYADIVVAFENNIPYVTANPATVKLQDFGVFSGSGGLVFEGVSWAPADGYSQTGKAELIPGHIYVLEIRNPSLHYAKFGVTGRSSGAVDIIWAYQTIAGLPELKAPRDREPERDDVDIMSL
jgi:hypothetical protein